jgi:hypothetical protein
MRDLGHKPIAPKGTSRAIAEIPNYGGKPVPVLRTPFQSVESKQMNWVLFVILASISGSEKAINSTAVPMATEQLCNAAKAKLTQAYQKTQSPNYVLVIECLQAQ